MRIRKGGKFSAAIALQVNGKPAFPEQQSLEAEKEEIGSSSRNAANNEKTRMVNNFDLNMPPADDEPPPADDELPPADDEPPPRYSFRKRSRKRTMFRSRADGKSWDYSMPGTAEGDPMEISISKGGAEELEKKKKCAARDDHVPDGPPPAEAAPEKAGGAATSVRASAMKKRAEAAPAMASGGTNSVGASASKKRAEAAPAKAGGGTGSARAIAPKKKTPVKDDEYWYYCGDVPNSGKAGGGDIPVIYNVSSDSD